jgi:hypothetical protein
VHASANCAISVEIRFPGRFHRPPCATEFCKNPSKYDVFRILPGGRIAFKENRKLHYERGKYLL